MSGDADLELVGSSADARDVDALLASLLARLRTLSVISGSQALGSIVAGLGRLGREASRTADGSRLREALRSTRVASNGEALWSRLGMDAAWSAFPPSPVLEELRNDLGLLLANDLEAALADVDLIEPSDGLGPLREPEPLECIDLVVGMWAYSKEIVAAIDTITAQASVPEVTPPSNGDPAGPVLR
ncbi:MAG: hypothetical protein AAFP84_04715 [Actinomycetota bacterium]